jgi:hypothetical protein
MIVINERIYLPCSVANTMTVFVIKCEFHPVELLYGYCLVPAAFLSALTSYLPENSAKTSSFRPIFSPELILERRR